MEVDSPPGMMSAWQGVSSEGVLTRVKVKVYGRVEAAVRRSWRCSLKAP